MLAYLAEEIAPGRTLSISQIYFDPGDIVALRARYDRLGMDLNAQFHALDAVKKQEMLMRILRLPGVFPRLMASGAASRQRFIIHSSLRRCCRKERRALSMADLANGWRCRMSRRLHPELRWLQMTDTRYVIVDKVHDIWHDDIAYDTALADFWQDVDRIIWPEELFDQARILHTKPLAGRSDALDLQNDLLLTETDRSGLQTILASDHNILAVTLTYSGNKSIFLQVQPPEFERILSSAIKIYRVSSKESRAYLASRVRILPDNLPGHEEALRVIHQGDQVVIHGDAELDALAVDQPGQVSIVEYDDTHVVLHVDSPAPAYLILRDAFYPGWTARIDGEPAPILRANVLFRALQVPAGKSRVVFTFEPHLWQVSLAAGVAMWVAALSLLVLLFRRARSDMIGT